MSMNFTIAASALSGAYGRLDHAAGHLVATAPTGDLGALSQAFGGLTEAKAAVRAATATLRAADEMTGAVLDMKA